MFDISAVVGFQGQVKPPGCRYRVEFRAKKFRWQWVKLAAGRASVSSGCLVPGMQLQALHGVPVAL